MKFRDGLDLLAPRRCLGCSRPGATKLCDGCLAGAPWTPPPHTAEWSPPGPLPCFTLLRFEGLAIDWIHRFKYPRPGIQGLDGPAWCLGIYLAEQLGTRLNPQPGDEAMPIPLHARRFRARGFNPAASIARAAFAKHPIRVRYQDLVRVRETAPQAGLGSLARFGNMKGAFGFRRRRGRKLPARVWLVDDVRTTGATLNEAAKVVREAGVRQIVCVALAQTPHETEALTVRRKHRRSAR
ncbi:MAG: phosphoribosyltransferase family protein [Myxococcota bacterium]|nr:phosphoribosyltransferase family protein [Myxococcota bacterium]